MTDKITWTGSPDDQTAKVGEYVLRAEEMGGYVWFCTYFYEERLVDSVKPNMEAAKTAAINAYKEHLKTK